MKKLIFLMSFVLCIGEFAFAQSLDNTIFRPIEDTKLSVTKAGIICSATESIDISSLSSLTSIAVSGSIEYDDYKYGFVRVILVDKNSDEYLIMEENKLFTKESKFDYAPTCIETRMLDNVSPLYIKIISFHALTTIDSIYYTDSKRMPFNKETEAQVHKKQITYWCNLWNQYNKENNQLWYASVDESNYKITYSTVSKMYGRDDSFIPDGMELYAGGIFVIRDYSDNKQARFTPKKTNTNIVSNYVESFDWRNRHGKNWITSIKNQVNPYEPTYGNGGCWAFAACGAVESAYQLYFNRITNIDLSEQELGSCSIGSLHSGGRSFSALSYIKNNSIMTEEDFPFLNNCTIPCSNKSDTPIELVNISSIGNVSNSENEYKDALINHGPVTITLDNDWNNHAMLLIGYKVVEIGDTIQYMPYGTAEQNYVINANSEYLGQTIWIMKNSFGNNHQNHGYLYAVVENFSYLKHVYYVGYPVTSSRYNTDSIICEDRDGDGYYFWGLGPKPAHCPVCAPDIPDGDDSNPTIGPIDTYGFPLPYIDPADTIIISSNTTISNTWNLCDHIRITNNATLTITSTGIVNLNGHNKIIVDSGTLVIDGGIVNKARVIANEGGSVFLRNNGFVHLDSLGYFTIEEGASFQHESGKIMR